MNNHVTIQHCQTQIFWFRGYYLTDIIYLYRKIFRLRTDFKDHQAQCILGASFDTYAKKEVFFNWAPTVCLTPGIHSCWPYQYFLTSAPSGPPPACVHAARFFFFWIEEHLSAGGGKQTKGSCQVLQAKTKVGKSGNLHNNNQGCHFNVD